MFGQRKVISTVKVMPVTSPPNSMAAVVQTKSILKTANDICTSPKTEKEKTLNDCIYVP